MYPLEERVHGRVYAVLAGAERTASERQTVAPPARVVTEVVVWGALAGGRVNVL